jgi:hypothetical protein
MGWPGWTLRVDGKERAWDQDLPLDQGIHYFEIAGRAPAAPGGPLPLAVLENGRDAQLTGRVMGLLPQTGMLAEYRSGVNRWDGAAAVTSRRLFAQERFYGAPDGVNLPLSATYRCQLQVPEDGEYYFETKPYSRCRLLLDGREVFNNFENVQAPAVTPIILSARASARLEAQYIAEGETLSMTFQLYYRRPGQKQAQWVPLEWMRLP